ncbi:MAG TPA: hypothetical protein VKP88_04875 [Candidatus Paceibacterota bacterium]|nr:hypothetical protein [Candidatus Paceibacterota bacterium]
MQKIFGVRRIVNGNVEYLQECYPNGDDSFPIELDWFSDGNVYMRHYDYHEAW